VIAITKIIFDRVETLEPWGMVMGEDDIGQKQPKVLAITSRKKLHKL
jgi:putative permease